MDLRDVLKRMDDLENGWVDVEDTGESLKSEGLRGLRMCWEEVNRHEEWLMNRLKSVWGFWGFWGFWGMAGEWQGNDWWTTGLEDDECLRKDIWWMIEENWRVVSNGEDLKSCWRVVEECLEAWWICGDLDVRNDQEWNLDVRKTGEEERSWRLLKRGTRNAWGIAGRLERIGECLKI